MLLRQIHQQGGNYLRLKNIGRIRPELKQGSDSIMNFKKRKNTLRKLQRTRKALQKTIDMINSEQKAEEHKYYQSLYDEKKEKSDTK